MPNTTDFLEEIAALKAMLVASEAHSLRKNDRSNGWMRIEEVIEPDGLAALAAVTCIASAKMYRNAWTSSPPRP